MGAPKPPAPPDPNVTAAAQTSTNIGTAIANTVSGQVNQVTPDGSLNYNQTGTFKYTDPISGEVHDIPQFTATTTLTPEGEAIQQENLGAQLGLARTANQQSNFLSDYLGQPATFDTSEIEGRLYDLGSERLDPRFEEQENALRQRLANQGVMPGSAAYESEMRYLNEGRNDAYNSLLLQGRGQAFGEMQATRNQPINEITALLSGSQVSQPNVASAMPAQIPTTDYAGIVNQDFANRMGIYDRQSQNRNQILGGLMGLASSGARAVPFF